MSNGHHEIDDSIDLAPGDEHVEGGIGERILGYLTGLGLAILLTATSFDGRASGVLPSHHHGA